MPELSRLQVSLFLFVPLHGVSGHTQSETSASAQTHRCKHSSDHSSTCSAGKYRSLRGCANQIQVDRSWYLVTHEIELNNFKSLLSQYDPTAWNISMISLALPTEGLDSKNLLTRTRSSRAHDAGCSSSSSGKASPPRSCHTA